MAWPIEPCSRYPGQPPTTAERKAAERAHEAKVLKEAVNAAEAFMSGAAALTTRAVGLDQSAVRAIRSMLGGAQTRLTVAQRTLDNIESLEAEHE